MGAIGRIIPAALDIDEPWKLEWIMRLEMFHLSSAETRSATLHDVVIMLGDEVQPSALRGAVGTDDHRV